MADSAWAQSPSVAEAEMVVNGVSRKGQSIALPVDHVVVEKAWKNYLKTQSGSPIKGESFWSFGKAKAPKGIYLVEEGEIDTISSKPLNIFSKVEGGPNNTTLWWSLEVDGKSLSQAGTPTEWNRSAALLQKFSQNLYLENIKSEVDFAEDVMVYSQEEVKQMERSASKIQAKITKTQEEKAKLESTLAALPDEPEDLDQEAEAIPTRQERALAAKTRELNDLTKKLEKAQMRQAIAKQEMAIMSQEMEAAKAKLQKTN
ncbi:hypothetical protein TH63_05175 [Rufibacter radiotolerans]|uniref:Uncharacterized protein n=1 Tax=Rufibacter radiotolerans TaxID=1379910 RepID=A0A0H4VMR7_9BACT|nr:hypothetical protein [Rufibacter radiotolerans]AKQ45162.1 hypothetical protein TH63_05175 [Rufibacter radiotolerans]